MEERYLHEPVLLKEVMGFLDPAPGEVIIDATVGGGGHAREVMRRISPGGTLIGIDKDPESLKIAHERLKPSEGSFRLINKDFRALKEITENINIREVDGVLFDLGISSIQVEAGERGFSIKNNGPLDMRMDRNDGLTARDLVNSLSEDELARLIRDYGEERYHRRIAGAIVRERRKKEILTTAELAGVICGSIPRGNRRGRIHPATRTFQALRISVNDELRAIEDALEETPTVLKKGGRLCVISFHSLEDRIAKNALREYKARGVFRVLTKKPVRAGEEEVSRNPRARSARLRAAVKL